MNDENDSLSGRFKRYASVSANLGGTALRFALSQLLSQDPDHSTQAFHLAKALGGLKGPLMKIAQFLATVPDAVPPEYTQQFLELQANAPPMGEAFVQRRMKGELGENWRAQFYTFNLTPSAAASLGQVHQASLIEGAQLACKLQYPNMAACVEADLNQLKLALKIYESTIGALRIHEIFQEITDRLREELDYRLEAKHMALYREILNKEEGIHVPNSFPDLSSGRLLTMTWLEGKPLKDILLFTSPAQSNQIAQRLFRAWYKPFYQYGVIHGDPHLGNYTFDPQGHINLLDFGCVRKFHASFVQGVIDLYYGLQKNESERVVEAYRIWGFTDLTKEKIEVLNLWAHLLYEPLMEDRIRPIQQDHNAAYGREMAAKVHQELRRLGGISPPREFVFMDRAAVGIGSVFMHLKAQLNWHQEFHRLIEGFEAEKLNQRQQAVFQSVGLGCL